tara:strand:- start:119 stop:298 length:180 start_codon:yes stop_codon:yes gene_type:complete
MIKKVKGVNISSLNKRQQGAMKRHAKHHTAKHIRMMVNAMKKGATFGGSHKIAMKKIGR